MFRRLTHAPSPPARRRGSCARRTTNPPTSISSPPAGKTQDSPSIVAPVTKSEYPAPSSTVFQTIIPMAEYSANAPNGMRTMPATKEIQVRNRGITRATIMERPPVSACQRLVSSSCAQARGNRRSSLSSSALPPYAPSA